MKNVKIILPNTNYWNAKNWDENKVPCPGNHIKFPSKTPKIFLNGVSKVYYLSELILPVSGELILDNMATLTSATPQEETHNCDSLDSVYNKVKPDFWYNPASWCEAKTMSSPCLRKPQIEASIVPTANDFVVFPLQSSFYIGVKKTEPKILANKIYFRGQVYTRSFRFQNQIRRTSYNQILEFVLLDSRQPFRVELQGNNCKKVTCSRNSNLKKMKAICQYVKCQDPDCSQQVKPEGSCCHICGHTLKIILLDSFNETKFSDWIDNIFIDTYQSSLMYDLLALNISEYQLTISPISRDIKDFNEITLEIMKKIEAEKNVMDIKFIECASCKSIISNAGISKIVIAFLWTIFLISLIVIIALVIKRFKPVSLPSLSLKLPPFPQVKFPTINLRFFRDNFSMSRLREEHDSTGNLSTAVFPEGIEVIELPNAGTEIFFDNPIYSPEIDDTKQ